MAFDFNYDTDTWIQFLKDNWVILLIGLVVLFIVVRIVKTVVKWLIVVVILVGLVVYSGYSLEDLKSIGTTVTENVKQEAITAMAGEAEDATYTSNSDGTFTITTKNLRMDGKPGDNEVKISFRGAPLGTWKIDETIQTLIEAAKKNA
ncbi:hypothetical protein ACFOLF_09960 [Paenibacillus sepulcri]|uniref:ATPase n=1 Tax=Paenibacillus sepulcri TaxID=359917 RepID=A0ABS7CE56_9BACL|nr:hypothetical protein [Paenibacillus sepulcri]